MIWPTVAVVIYTVCAIAGRAYLLTTFLNFLSLIGYWTIIWITLTIEEEFIFRRKSGYDWSAWNERKLLTIGIAALSAFLVGWVGAILCMDQTYFARPIAELVGGYGADVSFDCLRQERRKSKYADFLVDWTSDCSGLGGDFVSTIKISRAEKI